MKKHLLLLISLISSCFAFAQVDVTSSGGTLSASYTTLSAALAAVDSGLHTGTIAIGISANTTETSSATLIASGSGFASYTSISISPTGGASRTISGAITGHLIDLNGAKNVTINGLNTGGNTLTISNTATGASSCIRFINDASVNTITNCTITGSTTSFGNIFFSTGITTGNDSNIISNNNIGVAGSNFPINGIYSLGTGTSIENNANMVSGNNIFDYFSATVVTIGINVNTGNSNWTISNNRLYQTATRTYTTANTHNGISVTSGSGYTITGNIIGYAASNGTGTYTMAGTVATRFIGINIGVGTTAATSVQGNIIAAINLATSSGATTANGVICGINVTSGNVNIGTVTGNTIGAATGINSIVATPTSAGGLLVGINSSSVGTIDIRNNTIGALSCSGTTATVSGSVTGINVSGVATSITISNNTIGNGTANNLQGGTSGLTTGSSLVSGINLPSTPTAATINGNTIQNLSSFGTGSTGFVRGIHTAISGTTTYTITNNTVNNLTTNNANTSLSNGQLGTIGIFIGTGTSSVVSGNIISNISNTNSGAVSTNVAGISHAIAGNTIIRSNQIYNINNASTATSTSLPGLACGVFVRGGLNNLSIINNMISLGTGQTTNTAFVGIVVYSGGGAPTVTQVFHNTVFIGGTVTSGAQPSMGFYRGNFSTSAVTFPVDVRNNIFVNTRTGGTGPHFAIANNYGATTASASGWGANASNFNVLNANSATIGHWTTAQTISAWRTASAGDANSLSGITITFANSASGDLHLNMGTTLTQIESGGTTISAVNTDFDNQARPGPAGSVNGGAFAPDFGADEFDGVPLDLAPPTISFTAFANGPVVMSRTVTATISDGNVVRVATNGPQLYYKKTTDNNTYTGNTSADNGWKYVSASNVGSLFTFNIDYSLLNGGSVAVGDTIQYFIVAMDSSANSNVGISSGALALTPTSTLLGASNFPITGTINSYRIVASLSGNVTVGVGGTYTSFTNTGGLFDDINNKFVSGNITAQVISDISTETGAIGLLEFNAPNQLTIVPDAPVLRTVSTTSTILLGLLGADNVTIDGRSGGSGKYLLFQNNNTTTTSIALLISNQASTNNGCQNINIKNVLFESGSTNLSSGTLVNNIHIQNNGHRKINIDSCEFKKAYNGLVIGAGTVTTNYDSLFITNNTFGEDLSTKYLTFSGIQLFFTSNSNVRNNVFKNIITSLTLNNAGIIVSTGASNVVVEQNRIFGIRSTNTGLYGSYGISVLAGTNITLKNNAIYNINSTSYNLVSSTDNLFGIRLAGASGVKIYNNSVSIDGVSLNTTAAQYTACIANFGATNVEIVNNILRNAQTGFTGSKSYTLYLSSGTVTNASNNALFASGGNPVLALVGTTDYATLSALQTATGAHANSFAVNPVYQDTNSNLTPNSCILNNRGLVLADVTNDFNGAARSGTPDIGAIEFTPSTIAAPSVTTPVTFCKNVSATALTATGSNTLLWFMSASGGVGSTIAPTPSTTTAGSTNFFVADSSMVSGCISSRSQIVVNVLDSIYNNTIASTPQTICAGSTPSALTGSTPAGGTGSYTYTWLSSTTSATTGFAAASGTNNTQNYTPGALTQNTWFRRVVTSGSCNADTTLAVAITVNAPIDSNIVVGAQTICSGSTPNQLTGSVPVGGTGSYTYMWLSSTTSATTGFTAASGTNNTQNYTSGALTQNTWYRRVVTSGSCNADTTVALLITVNTAVASNTASGAQTICSGSTPNQLTGSTPTGGDGSNYTYTWLSSTSSATSGFAAASGTNNTQNYSPSALTANTWFRRIVSSGVCNADTSSAVAITVNPVIAGNTIGSNQSILSGATPAGLTGALPTGGSGTYTYTWLSSTTSATAGFSAASGTNNTQNYTPGALTQNTWYRRLVSSGGCTDTSAAVAITVNTAIAGNTITANQTICSGSTPSQLTGSTPTGGTGTYTYTWLSSTTSATAGFTAASGTNNTQDYTPSALTQNTWYRRYVVSGVATDTSAAVAITVNAVVASNTVTGVQTICSGSTPSQLTGSTPTGGTGTYTYTWLSSTTSATAGFAAASGTNNTQNYTPGSLTANTWYRRIVSSGVCTADTSAAVAITVNPVIAGNTIGSNQSILSGATPAGLTGALPTGGSGTYTYTWLSSTTSATAGFSAASGTNNTQNYTPGALTQNTWYRRLVSSGGCADTSLAVAITINAAISGNTITGTQTICSGSTPSQLTGSTPTGGTGTYTYTWLSSTTSATAGFSAASGTNNTQNYTPGTLSQNTWYRRYVVSGVATDTSAAVAITVNAAVASNTASGAQTICSGSTPSQLTGSAPTGGDGANYTYTWLSSTTSATAGFAAASGTNNTQNYTPGALTANTWYRRRVSSGACNADTSAAVAITVNAAGTWTGALSSVWTNTANWSCPQIPTSTTNVIIGSSAPNMPVITDLREVNSLTINAGATLTLTAPNGRINIYGNFVNNGTFANGSNITAFTGTSPQTIPSGTYGKLVINNLAGANLGGNVTVSDTLFLTNGIITLGSSSITLGNTAYVSGASAASYLKTNGTGNVIVNNVGVGGKSGNIGIPVGNATYNPVVLNNTGTTDNYTIWVIDSITNAYTGSAPSGAKLTSNAVNRTWIINEGTAGGSNVTVTLQWNAGDELLGFNRSAAYVSRYNGTAWNGTSASGAAGTNPYTLSRSGITSFSPFGVGSSGALPVVLISFEANKVKNNVLLTWQTASELNNAYFEVERSADGRVFEALDNGKIKGQGTTPIIHDYAFTDAAALAFAKTHGNTIYYRLKQVDFDGTFDYSEVRSVDMGNGKGLAQVQPNPYHDEAYVVMESNETGKAEIMVTDVKGSVVLSQQAEIKEGYNQLLLVNAETLQGGMYFVTIKQGMNTTVMKLVKK